MPTISRWQATAFLVLGLVAGKACLAAGQEPKPAAGPADAPKTGDKPATSEPSLADRLAAIKAEYEAQKATLWLAVAKATNLRERNAIYAKTAPDEVAYCRRMIDLETISKPVLRADVTACDTNKLHTPVGSSPGS